MDWYSWLSRTNLEPALAYEYGLSFTRNELQREDLAYFNHEFLVSMGINVAKHRLEILKLAKKELAGATNGFSKLVLAFNKTKKLFTRNISKLSVHKNSAHESDIPPPYDKMSAYNRTQWSGALRRLSSSKEGNKQEKAMIPTKNRMRSGPLDRRLLQDKAMTTNKCLSISGPLDGTLQEKWMAVNWSPIRAVPIDGKWRTERSGFGNRSPSNYGPWEGRSLSPMPCHYYRANVGVDEGAQSLWSLMFQDLKPT